VGSVALTASILDRIPLVTDILRVAARDVHMSPFVQAYEESVGYIQSQTDYDTPLFGELLAGPIPKLQSKISQELSKSAAETFSQSISPYDLARVSSAGRPGASAWITLGGLRYGKSVLSSKQYHTALVWRLGLPQPLLAGINSCSLGSLRHPPVDQQGVHFVNLNCGSANRARFDSGALSGEWRTARHDAIASVVGDLIREAGFRTRWQPDLPGLPGRKGDLEIFDFPRIGRNTILDVTCVCPYRCDHTLSGAPDGEPVAAARVAEKIKYRNYSGLSRVKHDFVPLAFDVFGGTAPAAELLLKKLASKAVSHVFGVTDGPIFAMNYAAIISKWSGRIYSVLTKEVANCIIEGARLARGGNLIDSSYEKMDMFETALPRM